ncbi:MAG TPA: hypothetical protein VIC31_11255 [Rudaea sp.]|jgi:cytoskeletal protein RodZ
MSNNNPQFERDFESFLSGDDARLEALYRKLPASEPDARLDAAVHALAQRAVAQPRARMHTRARWLPVSAAAAVVLIAAGIALRIAPQMQQRPAALPDTAPVATLQSAPATSTPVQSESVSVPPSPAPAAPAAAAAPAPSPPELRKSETASKPAPRAFPAPVAAMREAAPAAAADAKSATPAAAAPMRVKQTDAESAGAPVKTLAAPAAQDRNASLYPEHWLANIRQMLRDNQREEALRSLAEFRKRYPSYHLPDDLRDLH